MANTTNTSREQRRHEVFERYYAAREELWECRKRKQDAEMAPKQYAAMGKAVYEENREYCEERIAYWTDRLAKAEKEFDEALAIWTNWDDTEEEETAEVVEETEETTEVAEETEETANVLDGAQKCIGYWEAEEDEEMVAEAKARYQRVLDGTATEEDILGALDWLDYQPPTDPLADAIGYIASHWGTEETKDWLAHNEGNEAEAIAETLVLWQEEADAEGTEPVPAHLLEWANEQLA